MSRRSCAAAALVASAVTACVVPLGPVSAVQPETLFPQQGVPGLDVLSTRVVLDYDPTTRHLEATAHLRTRVVRPSSRLTLDLEGLTVSAVTVDGAAATYERGVDKLVIHPSGSVAGLTTITVEYAGTPVVHTDTDGSREGWVPTADGAVALGEPIGTMTWIPVDNTPADKFLLTVDASVPRGLTAVANGRLLRRSRTATTERFVWRGGEPIAAYLATLDIGRFAHHRTTVRSVDGRVLPLSSYVDPTADQTLARRALAVLPRVIAFEERRFGRYPFSIAGATIDPVDVGYALETQTRPFYPSSPDVLTVVHENAHQWYGDSVTLRDWHDIWLAEGFATYAEWLWDGAHGGASPAEHFRALYATPAGDALWRPAPTTFTDSEDLFGDPVYQRGAMTLQALRVRIGDPAFFRLLKTWARQHAHVGATTPAFRALAERISGRKLDRFFRVWLRKAGKPTGW